MILGIVRTSYSVIEFLLGELKGVRHVSSNAKRDGRNLALTVLGYDGAALGLVRHYRHPIVK